MRSSSNNSKTVFSRWTRFLGAVMAALMLPAVALALPQAPVVLGADSSFAILAGDSVTSSGATAIVGDIGVSPGTAMKGTPTVYGTMHAGDGAATQAQLDLTAAYNEVAGRTVGAVSKAGDLGGQTLAPGLYTSTSSLTISSGNLTLDAEGDSNAVFIFQMTSTLTADSGRRVILINSAKANNIFWQVGSSAMLDTASVFKGTIMAMDSITLAAGATLDGRALARTGVVTFDGNTVTSPPLMAVSQLPVDLRSTANFAVLAGSLISNIPTSAITGDIGLSPAAGAGMTGLGLLEVAGTIFAVDATYPTTNVAVIDPTRLTAAKGDLTIAYNDAAGRTPVPTGPFLNPGAGDIGGLTLVPGLYKFTSGVLVSITGSDVTLTGSATDVWIFQIASTLTVDDGIKVILAGGAQAANIFWQVGTSATLGTTSVFKGTIMADQSISLKTGAVVEGRLLARIGAVTLAGNTITKPAL
jgi:hypothetical protein